VAILRRRVPQCRCRNATFPWSELGRIRSHLYAAVRLPTRTTGWRAGWHSTCQKSWQDNHLASDPFRSFWQARSVPSLGNGSMGNLLTHHRKASLAASLLGLCVVTSALSPSSAKNAAKADDGWRRTTAGWEHKDVWNSGWATFFRHSPPRESSPLKSASRYDSHPAALALAETVLIILGFSAFPMRRAGAEGGSARSWQARIAASFRASAFGP